MPFATTIFGRIGFNGIHLAYLIWSAFKLMVKQHLLQQVIVVIVNIWL